MAYRIAQLPMIFCEAEAQRGWSDLDPRMRTVF